MPACLILSPVVLAAPAYSDEIVRKDVLGILLLIACLMVSRRPWPVAPKVAAINAIGVVAVLSHESFFFFGFAALVLAVAAPRVRVSADVRMLAVATIELLPIIAAFLLTAVFHGSSGVAQAVNNSWAGLWGRIGPASCCYSNPGAAIGALQWSLAGALSLPASALKTFSHGIYVPLAWLVTILVCFWFIVGLQPEPSIARRRLAATLIVLANGQMRPLPNV